MSESLPVNDPPAATQPAEVAYLVTLTCPTPLRDRELVVEAENESQAWSKFCRHNNITGSDHPKTIERL
jgi:hypothetical protein